MVQLRSIVWDDKSVEVTQAFGVNLPNVNDEWYAYAKDYGLKYGDHPGLDIGVDMGTPIKSASYGTVEQAGGPSQYFTPKPVYILTKDDPDTRANEAGNVEIYGHLWSNNVSKGNEVKPGQLLGHSGRQTLPFTMTPDGSGPHLHFELRTPDPSTPSGWKVIDSTNWLGGKTGVPGGDSGNPEVPDDPETPEIPDQTGIPGLPELLVLAQEWGPRLLVAIIGIGILVIGLRAII